MALEHLVLLKRKRKSPLNRSQDRVNQITLQHVLNHITDATDKQTRDLLEDSKQQTYHVNRLTEEMTKCIRNVEENSKQLRDMDKKLAKSMQDLQEKQSTQQQPLQRDYLDKKLDSFDKRQQEHDMGQRKYMAKKIDTIEKEIQKLQVQVRELVPHYCEEGTREGSEHQSSPYHETIQSEMNTPVFVTNLNQKKDMSKSRESTSEDLKKKSSVTFDDIFEFPEKNMHQNGLEEPAGDLKTHPNVFFTHNIIGWQLESLLLTLFKKFRTMKNDYEKNNTS